MRCRSGIALLTVLLTIGAEASAASPAPSPPLAAGVAVHGTLNWGHPNADHTGYDWPVYPSPEHDLPVDLLRKVRAYGFDFIRLTVDPGPMMALTGEKRDALDRQLVDDVKTIQQTGLDVLVDFHPIHMVKAYSPEFIESEGPDSIFPAYAAMVGRIAKVLSKLDPNHVALEPMNEPQMGYSDVSRKRWQGMMEKLYDAARVQAPNLTIMVTGCEGGGMNGLEYIDPAHFKGGHVRYSFHYYSPLLFTHQGVDFHDFKAPQSYVTPLPYPAKPSDKDAVLARVAKRIEGKVGLTPEQKSIALAEARKKLEAYFGGEGSHAAMIAEIARGTTWAQKNHIDPRQLFLGEFDATQKTSFSDGANPADRLRWLADVRTEAEKRGFGWCLWALDGKSGAGMELVNPEEQTRVDVPTAKALGKSIYTP